MSLNVLIADDSSTMRKIIARSLLSLGASELTEAGDGAQAVDKFKTGQYDLVLTDWNMPNKSGLEVVKEIRAENGQVPIIMITTEAEKTRVVEAIQAGVTDYLIKPFTAESLKAKLEKFGL